MKRLTGLLLTLLFASACASKQSQVRAAAQVELGHAYLLEGSYELAIETLQNALDLHPKSAEAWHELALALMARGNVEEADRAFRKARRLSDGDAAVLVNYGVLLQRTGRVEEAVEVLEEGRKDLTYRQPAKVLNNLGLAYMTLEQCDLAIARIEEAVRRAPHFCQAWFNLGLAFRCDGQNPKARDAWDRHILVCPDQSSGVWFQVGELLREEEQWEEAASAYDQALAYPDLPAEFQLQVQEALQEVETP